VVTHLSAIKIKISIRLIADLASERHNWRNLPVETSAGPNLAVRQDRMVESRDSICVPEIVIYTVTGLLHVRPYIKGHLLAHLKLETGRWHHRIKKPLRCNLPTNPGGRDNRVFPLHIDANPENKLQIRTVNVSAPY
jgi:hypothetical protein